MGSVMEMVRAKDLVRVKDLVQVPQGQVPQG
jgi:hypothetical protein